MAVVIKFFPPSWFQVKAGDKILYIDPAYLKTHYRTYPKKVEFSTWPDPIDGLPEGLDKADIILITHAHKDHCKGVTVNRLRGKDTLVLAPERCKKELGEDIEMVRAGDVLTFGDIDVRVVDAHNTPKGRSTKKVHHRGQGVGYLVTLEGKTIYHAGDTDYIPEMKKLGKIDVALMPIGGTYTMDIHDAVKATLAINPGVAIPMHHQKCDPREFKKKVEGRSDIIVKLLGTGEDYRVP